MSEPAVGDDESILNDVNSAEEPIDLDDAAIAELLGDNAVVSDKEEDVTLENIQIEEQVVIVESDEEIIEEIILPQENGTRKRSIGATSGARSPKPKRARQKASNYLAARRSVTNFITRLLGTYDRMLQVKSVHQFIGMINCVGRQVENEYLKKHREYTARIAELEKENQDLRQELGVEKSARSALTNSLTELRKEMLLVNNHIKTIQTVLPMPTTPEITDCLFGRKMTEISQAQITQHTEPVRPIPHLMPFAFGPRQRNLQNMQMQHRPGIPNPIQKLPIPSQPPRRQTMHPMQQVIQQQQNRPMEPRRSLPMPHMPPPPPAMRLSQGPGWASLPIPTLVTGGHTASPTPGPWELIDMTLPSAKTITVGIPLIPTECIAPVYNDDMPQLPTKFDSMIPNPNVEVFIKSSSKDFRENWQIGGKISYEKLPRVESKCIQLFVQVSSFKEHALRGKIGRRADELIEWGVSKPWDCMRQTHRFRIVFHRSQLIPHKDRIAIVAMIKDTETGLLDFSEPAMLTLN